MSQTPVYNAAYAPMAVFAGVDVSKTHLDQAFTSYTYTWRSVKIGLT